MKVPETDDFDPPDEDLYRSYSTWELEQLRAATLTERETGRSASGVNLGDLYT